MPRQTQLTAKRTATRGRPRKPSRRVTRRQFDDQFDDDIDEQSDQTRNSRSIEVGPSTAVVATTKEPESMLAQLAENEIVKMATPFVGAAGGALAITVATERYGVKREVATFGGAALALAAAQSVTGFPRDLLQAAATAGVCLGVVELLQTLRPAWLYRQPVAHETEHRQAAPPPDAITRSDLQQAIAELLKRNQADQVERDKAQAAQLQEVQALVRDLMTQLRDAQSEVQRLREAEAAHLHEREVAAAEAVIARNAAAYDEGTLGADEGETFEMQDDSTNATIAPSVDAADEPATAAPIEETTSPPVTTPDGVTIPPDVVDHFGAIYALLDADERQRLSSVVARLPKSELASAEAQLMQMEPQAAVDYLRSTLFPSLGFAS